MSTKIFIFLCRLTSTVLPYVHPSLANAMERLFPDHRELPTNSVTRPGRCSGGTIRQATLGRQWGTSPEEYHRVD